MLKSQPQSFREVLKREIAKLSLSVAAIEESIAVLESELNSLSQPDVEWESPLHLNGSADGPTLDLGTLSVIYQGKQCQLGNNLKFKLLKRLLRCPNRYVSYDTLIAEVWTHIVDTSSIRSVVKELRALLRAAGMASLAEATKAKTSYVREAQVKENRFLTLLGGINALWKDLQFLALLRDHGLTNRPELAGDFAYEPSVGNDS